MLTQDKINELREEFEKRFITKHYSSNGFYFNSDSIGYFDEVQTQPSVVIDFFISHIETLLKEQREELVEKIEKKSYCLLDRKGKFVDFEDIINLIKKDNA